MSWYYPYFCIDMSRCKSQKKLTQFENQQIGIATMMRLLDEAMDIIADVMVNCDE